MQFCDRCGSMMRLKELGNQRYFQCQCGYASKPTIAGLVESQPPKPELKVLLSEINPLAVHDHICPKCGFDKAQIASKGIQYTDEDEDVEYVCGRCGYHDKAEGLRAR